jgi:hypothetical protein
VDRAQVAGSYRSSGRVRKDEEDEKEVVRIRVLVKMMIDDDVYRE